MSKQAPATATPSNVTPIAKALSAAQVKALTKLGAAEIADAVWSATGTGLKLTDYLADCLRLPADQASAVIVRAFDLLKAKATAPALDVSKGKPTDAQRAQAAQAEAVLDRQWREASNNLATITRQARDKVAPSLRPVAVSVKLDTATRSAQVTIVPHGASDAEALAALGHDLRAQSHLRRRLEKEASERAEAEALAKGLPSPKADAKAKAEADKAEAEAREGLYSVATGKPLADYAPLTIAAWLAAWPSARLTELADLCAAQAKRNAKAEADAKAKADKAEAEAKAKAQAKASGKGAGANAKAGAVAKGARQSAKAKAEARPVAEAPAPAGERLPRPEAEAQAQVRNGAQADPAGVLTDPAVTATPADTDAQRARGLGVIPAGAAVVRGRKGAKAQAGGAAQ